MYMEAEKGHVSEEHDTAWGRQRPSLNPSTTSWGIVVSFVPGDPSRTRAMQMPGLQPTFNSCNPCILHAPRCHASQPGVVRPLALALQAALTLPPDEHVALEVCNVSRGDCSQDVTECGVTDLPGFCLCEEPGETVAEPTGGPRVPWLSPETWGAGVCSPCCIRNRGSLLCPPDGEEAFTHSWCSQTRTCRRLAGAQTGPG